MRVGLRRAGLLGLGHLGAEAVQLVVERRLVLEQDRELLVALTEAGLKLLELVGGLLAGKRVAGNGLGVEGQGRVGPGAAGVGMGEPVSDVKELADGGERVGLGDGAMAMDSEVAEAGDDRVLVKTASPTARLKVGSWRRALRLSW